MGEKMEDKPTVEYVQTLFERREYDYGTMYSAFDVDDQLYELDFQSELGLPKEYEYNGVVLPTARGNVDTFADYVNIDNARVSISRRKDTAVEKESADQLRKFGQGLIYMTNVQSAISPWRVGAKHYPKYGVTWFKDVYNSDLWPDKPSQKNGESDEAYADRISEWANVCEGTLPISVSVVNPKCIMFDKATTGQTWVIEFHRKPVNEIVRRYKNWKPTKNYDEWSTVWFVDYWDKNYRVVLVDGQPVLNTKSGIAKHGYGFVPYVCLDAGLGDITEDEDLAQRFVGINRYIKGVLISQSRDYSIQDIIIAKGGFPSGFLEGENAQAVQSVSVGYGEVNRLPPGVTYKEVKNAMAPSEVTQHYYTTTEIIDGHAIPRSLRGQSETNVRSGSDRRQLMGAAQYRLRYSEMAFKNRTALVLNNCARLLKKLPGNVTVFSHTPSDEFHDLIDKDKIREPISFHVEFSPVSEEDEYRRHDDFERMIQVGIVTPEWARKQMPNVSEKDIEKQQLKQKILNSPSMVSFIDRLVAAKMDASLNQIMAAEGLTPPAPPPGTGQAQPPTQMPLQGSMVTQNRQVAPLGSPQAMQNQLAQNRSQVPMNPTQGRSPLAGGSINHPQR